MLHTITITKEDVLESNYQDNKDCSVVRAAKRTFPDYKIFAGGDWLTITPKGNSSTIVGFNRCTLISKHKLLENHDLGSMIVDNYDLKIPEEIIFTFNNPFLKSI